MQNCMPIEPSSPTGSTLGWLPRLELDLGRRAAEAAEEQRAEPCYNCSEF
jgi:hypothetical protein